MKRVTLLFILIAQFTISQTSNFSEWITLDEKNGFSLLEGRARVARVLEDRVGYQWEFRIRIKSSKDRPDLEKAKIYIAVFQEDILLDSINYIPTKPLRICFLPSARNKTYVAPKLFWMRKNRKNPDYEWKEGDIFPIAEWKVKENDPRARFNGQKFEYWRAILAVKNTSTEDTLQWSFWENLAKNSYILIE